MTHPELHSLQQEVRSLGTTERAKNSVWFFKTGPGQYGEGDVFIGVTVPSLRKVSRAYAGLSLADIETLLHSPEHEFRLLALFILVIQFQKAKSDEVRETIYNFYLANTQWINNWDLVDSSAGYIVGEFLKDRSKKILITLAHSKSLWERRIAIISTFAYIKDGDATDALAIARILLHDTHDLIQKAVGWMLREVGKRCGEKTELQFLDEHYKTMPRTMLRYAIERLSEKQRRRYMGK